MVKTQLGLGEWVVWCLEANRMLHVTVLVSDDKEAHALEQRVRVACD